MERDRIFYGGDIITMQPGTECEAVLVRDGKIHAIGTGREMLELSPGADSVDLEGKTLMPGMIDSHSHFAGCAASRLQVSLEGVKSWREIRERIEEHRQENRTAPGEWIVGYGLDPLELKEGRAPEGTLLDMAAPGHPVVIQYRSGHGGVFSYRALRELSVKDDGSDQMERQDGRLTGRMREQAFMDLVRRVPMPSEKQQKNAFCLTQRMYASYGITTVQEGMAVDEILEMYENLIRQSEPALDVVLYLDYQNRKSLLERARGLEKSSRGRVRVGGYKIFLDGSIQEKTAWLTKPYAAETEPGMEFGRGNLTDEAVIGAVETAVRDRMQLLAHANGDRAAEQFLEAVRRGTKHPQDRELIRPVLIHSQMVRPDQLIRMKELGITPSFFAAHVYYWGETHRRILGEERAAGISPCASAWKAGLPFTLHQDSPVLPPDMMGTIWCVVNRLTKAGRLLGPKERISVQTALWAVTVHAAAQYGEPDKGRILPGMRADLVILDQNPLKIPSEDLKNVSVLATVKDGVCIFM